MRTLSRSLGAFCLHRSSLFTLHAPRTAPFLASLLLAAGGCARLPPSQNALSGVRLRVTLRFGAPINPLYYYYFLVNNAGDRQAPGPIPVLGPISGQSYGNGFATGSTPGSSGFTDFVLFTAEVNQYPGSRARGGYGVYHVVRSGATDQGEANNRANLRATGAPVAFTTPPSDPGDLQSAVLQFEIDLSQLITDPSGQPLSDPAQAANLARAIRYLQTNVVATNITPVDPQTSIIKLVDSLGDTSGGQGYYFTLDVGQGGLWPSGPSDPRVQTSLEPSSNDIYIFPPGANVPRDPALDLRDWRIEVVRTQ